jgi:flavin-dependent thymidylate synthase
MNNTCELIGHYGGDLTHAGSAWTSTNRNLSQEKIDRIPKLLEFLKEGSDGQPHGTPFEKSALHFLVTTDVATHIHIIKHRIGVSVNGESARYKELADDKALIPHDWPDKWQEEIDRHAQHSFELYHKCLNSLVEEYGFTRKRAKESARFFNPYCTQLTADVQFNFRSFTAFCYLRAVPHAQLEVNELAKEMIRQVDAIRTTESPDKSPFHHSIRAWKLDVLADISDA